MKMKVNAKKIKALTPCDDRFDNFLKHYAKFNGDMLEFLALKKITANDKVWVAVRLMPRHLVEVFAIDCAVNAQDYAADAAADATAAAYYAAAAAAAAAYRAAANAAYYAAHAAADADAMVDQERERQVDALAFLMMEGV